MLHSAIMVALVADVEGRTDVEPSISLRVRLDTSVRTFECLAYSDTTPVRLDLLLNVLGRCIRAYHEKPL